MSNGRSKGFRISTSQRIEYAKQIRALLEKDESLSILELQKRTGAPFDMTNVVKRKWLEARLQRMLHGQAEAAAREEHLRDRGETL